MADAIERRPRAVPVVAAFLFVVTVIAAVVGISLVFPNRLTERLWELNKPGAALFHSIGRVSGVFLLALGVATAAAARGLLRRRQWAWWFAVILFAIDGSGDVVSFFVTGDWLRSIVGAIITSVFLCFLCQRNVRYYFRECRQQEVQKGSFL
jgi:lysylphosphatidylglycerol synthetase-like protein (DUF2156 family)